MTTVGRFAGLALLARSPSVPNEPVRISGSIYYNYKERGGETGGDEQAQIIGLQKLKGSIHIQATTLHTPKAKDVRILFQIGNQGEERGRERGREGRREIPRPTNDSGTWE